MERRYPRVVCCIYVRPRVQERTDRRRVAGGRGPLKRRGAALVAFVHTFSRATRALQRWQIAKYGRGVDESGEVGGVPLREALEHRRHQPIPRRRRTIDGSEPFCARTVTGKRVLEVWRFGKSQLHVASRRIIDVDEAGDDCRRATVGDTRQCGPGGIGCDEDESPSTRQPRCERASHAACGLSVGPLVS
jgi:hypothetical protein